MNKNKYVEAILKLDSELSEARAEYHRAIAMLKAVTREAQLAALRGDQAAYDETAAAERAARDEVEKTQSRTTFLSKRIDEIGARLYAANQGGGAEA